MLHRFGQNGIVHKLVEGRDGAIYGAVAGKIFRLTPGGDFRVVYDFESENSPDLIAAEDGHLYGTFRFNLNTTFFRLSYTGRLETICEFPFDAAGYPVDAGQLIMGPDGAFYGIAHSAGGESSNNPRSTLFRATMEGEITTVADFAAAGFTYPRRLIVGHDGAFRLIARARTSAHPWEFDTVVRVSLDGNVSSALSNLTPFGDLIRVLAHPDGHYYIHRYGGMMRLSAAGEVTPILDPYGNHWQSLFLGRDGFFYAGRSKPGWPTGMSELLRIRPDGTYEDAVDSLGDLLGEPWIFLQTHRSDCYGVGADRVGNYTVLRWTPPGQVVVNIGPYAQADFARPPAPGRSRAIRVLSNDRDVDGDPLTITAIGNPRLGTATLAPSGREILYTAPAEEPVAVDEFTYTISDGQGGRGIGRVTLRANGRGNFTAQIPHEDSRYDGHLGVRVSSYGALTGRLWLGGVFWRFAGTLDADNHFAATVASSFGPAELRLDLKARGAELYMEATTVVNGVVQEHVLTAPNLKKAAAAAGAYTFVIPAKPAWRNLPQMYSPIFEQVIDNPLQQVQGAGFGRWNVLRSGAVTVSGRMPDGEPFTAGNWMDSNGRLQLFASLYPTVNASGQQLCGWIRGAVNFRDVPGMSDADAQCKWIVMMSGIGFFAPPLEEEIVTLQASRYTQPRDLQTFLPAILRAELDGGGLNAPIAATVRAFSNGLAPAPPLRLNGRFNPETGLFSGGHLSRTDSGSWAPWSGVLMQKQRSIFGQFREFGRHYVWQMPPGTGSLKFTPN